MLPDFRFVIGATLATAMLGIAIFGLATAVRLSHEAKMGPPETLRSSAFDERADWNQFSDPELARRFDALARQAEAGGATLVPEAVAAAEVPQPALAVPVVEAPAPNELPASIPPNSEANLTPIEDGPTTIDDMAAKSEQEPLLESDPAAIASLPTQEPVVTGAIATEPVESPAVMAETVPLANIEFKASEPTPVNEPPIVAERVASIPAAPNDAEVARAEIGATAAPPFPQLRTPPLGRKPALAKPPSKVKVAKASKARLVKTPKAKPRPRAAAKQPAAPKAAAAPRHNAPFGGGLFKF